MVMHNVAGPCAPWDPILCCEFTEEQGDFIGPALQMATEILWAKTGRQFGLCEYTIRPCRRECADEGAYSWWDGFSYWPRPAKIGATWYNLICGSCSDTCSCTPLSEAILPNTVHDVTEVKLDGVVLNPSEYRLDDGNKLVLINGTWPYCQDMNAADTEPNTWSVTANYGIDVPTLGKRAVGELACQFVKACSGDNSCALPKPVQSLARQGVEMTFLDPNEVFADGKLGLYWSDLFISTFNPNKLVSRSRVYSVGRQNYRRVGT